ncbi:hypothetical protein LAC81_35220 (plasmid) [Ensifer adhaerens]|nr:hypothetical protein [Ensifer adhaerens]MBZ7927197.1 hypothetical protein [Ensifer adhaerens]UAX98230.1 hypothetical protein LAC78_36520 [Ensifer adhaerens]UAY05612.1 hypothetical protein LAC80_35225 [Ensifer adhaerens]UAY12990.1 hypothetical protein LAC81_35220 [Ensifer adhaerens]
MSQPSVTATRLKRADNFPLGSYVARRIEHVAFSHCKASIDEGQSDHNPV